MTETHDGTRTIYQRFAHRCEERGARLSGLLEQFDQVEDPISAYDGLMQELHDWVGESKMLGLDRLTDTVGTLMELLQSWGPNFCLGVQGIQLRTWVERLTVLSRRFIRAAPDERLMQQVQKLQAELQAEMGVSCFGEEPTGDFHQVRRDSRRILVFDDSPIIGDVLRLALETRGHQVGLAADISEFRLLLGSFHPQIIFLDVNMPDMKGDEVCRRLRDHPETREVPIIFLSSLPDEELSVLCRLAGADGYLSKQHGMDRLLGYLDELLDRLVN